MSRTPKMVPLKSALAGIVAGCIGGAAGVVASPLFLRMTGASVVQTIGFAGVVVVMSALLGCALGWAAARIGVNARIFVGPLLFVAIVSAFALGPKAWLSPSSVPILVAFGAWLCVEG